MSIGILEKQVFYDNPCAPIVKFSYSNNIDEEDEDMNDDQISSDPTLGLYKKKIEIFFLTEHSFRAFSLDLVKLFDNTINSCFFDQQIIESKEKLQTDLIATSKFVFVLLFFLFHLSLFLNSTWSNLIENLRTSLRNDLKLPNIKKKLSKNNE
jgi:hypothetical protein